MSVLWKMCLKTKLDLNLMHFNVIKVLNFVNKVKLRLRDNATIEFDLVIFFS